MLRIPDSILKILGNSGTDRMYRGGIMLFGIITAMSLFIALYVATSDRLTDSTILKTFAVADATFSYSQAVQTRVDIADRTLFIDGYYLIDLNASRFEALSTTTIVLPDLPLENQSHSFTHENISIGSRVFTRVRSSSPVLLQTIPHSESWRVFQRSSIPREYADIAVAGPILDNLGILRNQGKYVRLIRNHGVESFDGRELARYTFVLSGETTDGVVQTVMDRIGEGTIDLWVVPDLGIPDTLVFSGDGYRSTTTISLLNSIPEIREPF